LTWYKTTLEGKKQTIHPHLSSEKLWIIEQVGCASHSDFQSERDKVLDKFKDCIMRVDLLKKYFDIQMPVAKVE
jgi:hypothetical protein